MKRRASITLLALIAVLLIGTPVFAYIYRAPYTVTSENTTDFEMLGVYTDNAVANQWMADNGFFNSTANDTRIETLGGLEKPHMVTENATFTAIPVPPNSQTNLYFSTGNSEQDFCIIPGYGGYITVEDEDVTLELGDNFTIEQSGWVDTTYSVNRSLVLKEGVFRTYVSADGAITSHMGQGVEQLEADVEDLLIVKGVSWYAQTFTFTPSVSITAVAVYGEKVGDGAELTLGIRTTTGGKPDAADTENVTLAVGDMPPAASPAWSVIELDAPISATGGTMYALVARCPTGSAGHGYGWARDQAAPAYTGGTFVWSDDSGDSWNIDANTDMLFRIYGDEAPVTATGFSPWEYTITTTANTTHMWIDIDGDTKDTVALGGASVPNTTANWTFCLNNVMPYMEYLRISVDGTLQLWFQPNDIISGTTLPDRATPVANDGTFHWGANPQGVSVTMGGLVSVAQPSPGVVIDDPTPDIMPGVEVTDWYIEPDVGGALLTNPLRPFVTIMSDTTTLTELQAWRLLGTALLLMVVVGTAGAVRGHQGITAIAAGACMVGLVTLTIYPMWAVVVAVVMFIGGLIAERSPSL